MRLCLLAAVLAAIPFAFVTSATAATIQLAPRYNGHPLEIVNDGKTIISTALVVADTLFEETRMYGSIILTLETPAIVTYDYTISIGWLPTDPDVTDTAGGIGFAMHHDELGVIGYIEENPTHEDVALARRETVELGAGEWLVEYWGRAFATDVFTAEMSAELVLNLDRPVTLIPEPSTALLLGLGLVALAARRQSSTQTPSVPHAAE